VDKLYKGHSCSTISWTSSRWHPLRRSSRNQSFFSKVLGYQVFRVCSHLIFLPIKPPRVGLNRIYILNMTARVVNSLLINNPSTHCICVRVGQNHIYTPYTTVNWNPYKIDRIYIIYIRPWPTLNICACGGVLRETIHERYADVTRKIWTHRRSKRTFPKFQRSQYHHQNILDNCIIQCQMNKSTRYFDALLR
jgi:hypothetical protein